MNEHILKQRIHALQDDILRLNKAMFALEGANYKDYPENFLELSLDTTVRAEKIACKLRHLIGEYGMIKREFLMKRVSESHGINVSRSGEILIITIPRLLPKTKRARSGEFINQPLFYAMSKYCDENKIEKVKDCAVCFLHVYDKELSLGRIRDYDNTETRNILNTVATFFMIDDNGRWCDAYHTTMIGESDCTRIYIMPQKVFPCFVSQLKSSQNHISNFDGNL